MYTGTGTSQNIENRITELLEPLKIHDVPKLDEIVKESFEGHVSHQEALEYLKTSQITRVQAVMDLQQSF